MPGHYSCSQSSWVEIDSLEIQIERPESRYDRCAVSVYKKSLALANPEPSVSDVPDEVDRVGAKVDQWGLLCGCLVEQDLNNMH